MRARIYINDQPAAETDITVTEAGTNRARAIAPADSVTVVFFDANAPASKRLFLHGKAEPV